MLLHHLFYVYLGEEQGRSLLRAEIQYESGHLLGIWSDSIPFALRGAAGLLTAALVLMAKVVQLVAAQTCVLHTELFQC